MKLLLLLFLCLLLAPVSGTGSHPQQAVARYRHLVHQSARRYRIDPRLIFAIIEIESNFNPHTMGFQHGFGLMQVVPSTAGRDVFARLKKRSGQPTRRHLFDPRYNIDIGTAYLHLLQTVYLAKIKHPASQHYAMIAAYNGGHGNLFKTFATHPKKAIHTINQLTPHRFYQRIIKHHPLTHTRAYLAKVTHAQSRY